MARPFISKAFLFCLALLLGSEAIARSFFARRFHGRFEYGYNPDAGFRETDSGLVKLVRAGGRRFFPQEFSILPKPGTLRIITVGDSVPRGPSLKESYVQQAAAMTSAGGLPAEGINMCLGGNGVRRNRIVLERALKYQPGLVILHLNNSNEFEDEREWRRSVSSASWAPQNWLRKSFIIGGIHEAKTEQVYWKWIPAKIRARDMLDDADAELQARADTKQAEEWKRRVETVFQDSVAAAQRLGIPVLIVSQCTVQRDPEKGKRLSDNKLDAFAATLAGHNVYHLSMKDTLEPLDFPPLFADGSHLRTKGHEILARAVSQIIFEKGIAPK
jgi:hypothetical protein